MATNRTVAVLAGGASRRMGRDKARLEVAGETLLARTVRLALEAGAEVCVVGGASSDQVADGRRVRLVPDAMPGEGPLAALSQVLELGQMNTELIACACDMPRLTRESFLWLFERGGEHPAGDGVSVTRDGQIEPLFSLYRPSCTNVARELLTRGERSLRLLLDAGDFATAEAPAWLTSQLINVNTPDEWQKLQMKIQRDAT